MRHLSLVRILIVAFTFCSLLFYLWMTLPLLNTTSFDDAYIFLRYAKHFLSGHGFSWNPSEGPAYGISSVLHLLTVTTARGLTNIPDAKVVTTLSFCGGLLSCLALIILGFLVLSKGEFRRSWLPVIVAPCLLMSNQFWFHSLTGMETTSSLLFNSLLAISVVVFCKSRSKLSFAFCLFMAYASYLTRTDNGIYCLLLPPLFFVATDRHLGRNAVIYTLLFVVIIIIDLFFKKALLGDMLPLPFYAKRAGFYLGYLGANNWNAYGYMLDFFMECLPYLVVIACFITKRAVPRLMVIFLPVVLTFGYYMSVIQIMGFHARYYYPSQAFIVFAAFIAVDCSLKKTPKKEPATQSTITFRILAVAVLLLLKTNSPIINTAVQLSEKHMIGQTTRFEVQRRYTVQTRTNLPNLEWWDSILQMANLLSKLPSDIVVAASEYGYIGSTLPSVEIIDLMGLNNRYNAKNGFSADYLFSRHPDFIWLPHPDYSYITKEILDSSIFAYQYEFYTEAYRYGVAIRKASPYFNNIKTVLERDFSRLYPGRELSEYKAEPVQL